MDTAKLLNLFKDGEFVSHSGINLPYKIDCDALGTFDLQTLAKHTAKKILPFTMVVSVPRGGDAFAKELTRYAIANTGIALLVDDVLTTGKSMEEAKQEFLKDHPKYYVVGIVIFARKDSIVPGWIHCLYRETL